MGCEKGNFINFNPNYDSIHQNVKPNVGTISKCLEDYPITNRVKNHGGYFGDIHLISFNKYMYLGCVYTTTKNETKICHTCMYHGQYFLYI